ncbi:MAG: amidoligase family protein [Pseudomonadota bacterium]
MPHSASLAHLRAFIALQHWIVVTQEIDLSRRATRYAALFDRGFEALVLRPDYRPDWTQLIVDYIEHNPTRNRALDLLPVFAHVDEPLLRRRIDDPRIKSRPTYHYRLSDCRIGEPAWTIDKPWRCWLEVERLAGDADRLDTLARARLDYLGKAPLRAASEQWIQQCQTAVDAP